MNRHTQRLALMLATLIAGLLAAGCGAASSASSVISSIAASHSVTISPPSLPSSAAAPAPAPSAQSPAAAATPAASGSSFTHLWLWIILAAIVVVIIIVMIARSSGKRSATAASRRSKVIDVYAKGEALHDAIRVAEAPGALAAADAGVRWADIQRRADDLTQELYSLRETARDELERTRVEDVLRSLQAVRSAMTAERDQPGAGAQDTARMRVLLQNFEMSLRTLRDPSGQRL
jgi:hypothetical protein